jgi:two-component system chemotaxis sensor kinase CheA
MSDMENIVNEFLVETHENLDQLDRYLVTLEKNPTDKEILGVFFVRSTRLKVLAAFSDFPSWS